MTAKKPKLIPPDVAQCQVMKSNGTNFMTFGGAIGRRERCTNKPTTLVKEKKAAKDGLKGSMTMCSSCFEAFKKQEPNMAKHVEVTILVEDQPCT
jgi:hypothetical protein